MFTHPKTIPPPAGLELYLIILYMSIENHFNIKTKIEIFQKKKQIFVFFDKTHFLQHFEAKSNESQFFIQIFRNGCNTYEYDHGMYDV